MGKPVEFGTPLGWASFLMKRAQFILDRSGKHGPEDPMPMKDLFRCRLDLKEMLDKLDEVGVPKTWDEMEKYEKTACGGTVDAPGSNPGAPTGREGSTPS